MRKLLLFLLVVPGWAVAEIGSSRATVQGRFRVEEVARFAKSVEQSLAENGVLLALVGRIGRPQEELPPGVEFSHVGLAVYSKIQTADGRVLPGYATYNLYQKTDRFDESELVQDYILDFFLGAQELKVGIPVSIAVMLTKSKFLIGVAIGIGAQISCYALFIVGLFTYCYLGIDCL